MGKLPTDVMDVLARYNKPVVGVGVTAFNRLGPDRLLPEYKIICMSYSKELDIIKKDVDVIYCVETPGLRDVSLKRTTPTTMKNEEVVRKIKASGSSTIYIGKFTKMIADIARNNGLEMIANRLGQKLEDKFLFRDILEKCGVKPIPGEILCLKGAGYGPLEKRYGDFVLQMQRKSGGKGTFFIRSEEEFNQAKEAMMKMGAKDVLLTKFISGPSPSMTACATKNGTVCTGLQWQLLDIEECMDQMPERGVFCGHDWTMSRFPVKLEKQAREYASRIGKYMYKMGFKGIFGLDFVYDSKGKLYVVECNPRLLGSFPVFTMVQLADSEVPILAFHLAELLGLDYKLDPDGMNDIYLKKRTGAQLVLYSKIQGVSSNKNSLEAGIYTMGGRKLKFRRPGYDIARLKSDEEFILTDGMPFTKNSFRQHQRIMRFMTLHPVMDKGTRKLNTWASDRIKAVYKELDMS